MHLALSIRQNRYSLKKFCEKRWFHTIRRVDASCTDPQSYANRFYNYIDSISVDEQPVKVEGRTSTYGYI